MFRRGFDPRLNCGRSLHFVITSDVDMYACTLCLSVVRITAWTTGNEIHRYRRVPVCAPIIYIARNLTTTPPGEILCALETSETIFFRCRDAASRSRLSLCLRYFVRVSSLFLVSAAVFILLSEFYIIKCIGCLNTISQSRWYFYFSIFYDWNGFMICRMLIISAYLSPK